jgi:hypothetical protein
MDLQWEYKDQKDVKDWKLLLELGSPLQRSQEEMFIFLGKKIGVVSCLNFLILGHKNSCNPDPDPEF